MYDGYDSIYGTTMLQSSLEIKPDADGEERVFLVDVVLELDIRLYQEETETILLDIYTPKLECIPRRETQMLEQLVVRNAAKCRVSDRISVEEAQGKILQICHGEGSVKVDSVHQAEHGIQVEGIVQVRILYSISDDEIAVLFDGNCDTFLSDDRGRTGQWTIWLSAAG